MTGSVLPVAVTWTLYVPAGSGQIVADRGERHVGQDGLAIDPDVDVRSVRRRVHDTNEASSCAATGSPACDQAEAPSRPECTRSCVAWSVLLDLGSGVGASARV